MRKIDYDLLMSLTDILKDLAGAKLRGTRSHVEGLLQPHEGAAEASEPPAEVVIGGRSYPTSMIDELQVESSFGDNPRVTPAGARFLVELYQNDMLPMTKGVQKQVGAGLMAYIESETDLLARTDERAAKRRMQDEQHRAKVEHPESVPEADFTYSVLEDIFITHKGYGAGTMAIGGIEVTKSVSSFSSNSGKSSDWQVTFRWTSANGEPKSVQMPSIYKGNRSNDPDRNWGLGRE